MKINISNKTVLLLLDAVIVFFLIKAVAIDYGILLPYQQEDINTFALFGFGMGAMAFFHTFVCRKEAPATINSEDE